MSIFYSAVEGVSVVLTLDEVSSHGLEKYIL